MALIIDVAIQLRAEDCDFTPEARFWVDAQSERGLNTEIELPLTARGEGGWSGTLALEDETAQFLYRLGLRAHPGALWTLTIRNKNAGYTLLSDTDELGAGKAWLTGLCALPRLPAAKRKCVGAQPRAELPIGPRRKVPYLLLLDR